MIKRCFGNKDWSYCRHMKNVDVDPPDSHKIVEESDTSYSCAWCKIYNCPCEDLGYTCQNVDLVKGHWDENMNWVEKSI